MRFYESQAIQEKLPSFPITSAAANVSLDDPAVDAQAAAANRQPAGRDDETQLQVRQSLLAGITSVALGKRMMPSTRACMAGA